METTETVTTSNIELEDKNDNNNELEEKNDNNNELAVKKEKKRSVRFEFFVIYSKLTFNFNFIILFFLFSASEVPSGNLNIIFFNIKLRKENKTTCMII